MKIIDKLKKSKLGKTLVLTLVGVVAIGGMAFAYEPGAGTAYTVEVINAPSGYQTTFELPYSHSAMPYSDGTMTIDEYSDDGNAVEYYDDIVVDYELMTEYADFVNEYPGTITIYSGFRAPNITYGSTNSAHREGKALDIGSSYGSAHLLDYLGIPTLTHYSNKVPTTFWDIGYDVNTYGSGANTAHVEVY